MVIQLLFVLACIFVGARLGGIGLGVTGGLGVAVLTFAFHLQPTSPPVDVMLMILSVITAASCMQAVGGLDYLVGMAERLLRRHPAGIVWLSPFVTYLFTFIAGTGHVAYSILPVIAEVAAETKIRPERPLGIAVIASQQAVTASPVSAATVALLALLVPYHISLFDILKISVPATLAGVFAGAAYSLRVGKELDADPEYRARVESGAFRRRVSCSGSRKASLSAKVSVGLFVAATALIVLFGSVPSLRPCFPVSGRLVRMGMPHTIEIVMLAASALILLLARVDGIEACKGNVFRAGMQAVIAIFGIAWMGDTFLHGNMTELIAVMERIIRQMPYLFGAALFAMSVLLYSQAATVRTVMPLGIALGLSPYLLIALFPAVNGYFFIPNYPTIVAAVNFDRTGTTRIGKYILNHSFMMPGLIATGTALLTGFLLVRLYT